MNEVVKLSEEYVKEVFAVCTHQNDVLLSLFKAVFPEWRDIEQLDGFPRCNRHTALTITGWFMEFDRKHHPDVMNGGAWMNMGFSSDGAHLKDWEVERCSFTLKQTELENAA